MAEIAMPDLKKHVQTWFKEFQDTIPNPKPGAPAGQPGPVQAAQEVQLAKDPKVQATVDGKPVDASLIKAGQADMAAGVAGILEKGDNLKIMKFPVGPLASGVAGLALGIVVSNVVDARFLPWSDANGVPVATKPATGGKPNWVNVGIHVGAAVAVGTYGQKFIGKTAAIVVAASIFTELALKYTPLASWIDSLSKPLAGNVVVPPTNTQLAQSDMLTPGTYSSIGRNYSVGSGARSKAFG